MKKKEKEHLKADPFVHFFEKTYAFFKNNRRGILMAAAVAALAVIILLAVFWFQNMSSASENKAYAEAFRVRTDAKLSVDQKISPSSRT